MVIANSTITIFCNTVMMMIQQSIVLILVILVASQISTEASDDTHKLIRRRGGGDNDNLIVKVIFGHDERKPSMLETISSRHANNYATNQNTHVSFSVVVLSFLIIVGIICLIVNFFYNGCSND
jgi:Ca2+/Na+ antiporter